MTKLRKQTHLWANFPQEKKIKMLLTGLGSVCMGKHCDRGLENAAQGCSSELANNIYVCRSVKCDDLIMSQVLTIFKLLFTLFINY